MTTRDTPALVQERGCVTFDLDRQLRTTESFGIVADWTHALGGKGDLTAVAMRLMRLFKADALMVLRVSITDDRTKYVERCDAQMGKIWTSPTRSYARRLLGDSLPIAKSGAIIKRSDLAWWDASDTRFDDDEIPERLKEIIVVPLETHNGQVDILELHYDHQPAPRDIDLLSIMVGTLSQGWQRRVPGFVSRRLVPKRNFKLVHNQNCADLPLLGVENPAQLTRSEFRICSLLKDGNTVNLIANTLSISPVTVRSHLSSIFSKTGTRTQVELLHRLHRQQHSSADTVNLEAAAGSRNHATIAR